jgi:chorismate mutase/prephenate dehydratase
MIQVTLDMFLTSEATICGEVELRVHQCLHSLNGRLEDIKRVYAHAQSLQQCKTWLRINLPNVECIAVGSNAEAARLARHADDAGAIAGETAGRVYGLKTVAQAIEDRADNTTRFLVIGRSLFPPSGNDRTSLLITVNDKPGALYHVLKPFAEHDISLNRIESRPAHSGKWQYAFFIDVSGHINDEPMQAAMKEMGDAAAQVRVLGSYPVALP